MVDLTKLSYSISSVTGGPDIVVAYGKFLQVTFDFVIIAAVVFALISVVNTALKKPMKAEKKLTEDIVLLMEIRDALVGKSPKSGEVAKLEKTEKPVKKAVTKKKSIKTRI